MNRLKALMLAAFFLISGLSYAQTTQKATTAKPATTTKLKKDGTPDKRFKEAKHLKKDGTPDKRYKVNADTTAVKAKSKG